MPSIGSRTGSPGRLKNSARSQLMPSHKVAGSPMATTAAFVVPSYDSNLAQLQFSKRAVACVNPHDPARIEAAARLLWKIEKAYSLGIPKKNLAHGESQTEEEYAYGEKYTMFQPNGRSFWT